MIVPVGPDSAEISVKASRFIAQLHLIDNQNQVKEIISGLRQEHPGANHIVWAFILGSDRSIFGYSDDREPKGSAGRPVFEVLKGSGISNTLITVVRYFGGTRLGTGGLARAYSDSAKAVLEKIRTKENIEMATLSFMIEYSAFENIKHAIEEIGGSISQEDFGEKISLSVEVPQTEKANILKKLQDITSGQVEML